jgi:hypothetical protein
MLSKVVNISFSTNRAQFEMFKQSRTISKKTREIEIVDFKDNFGVFRFAEKGIDFFGVFPKNVVYIGDSVVHPDNFEGEGKIKTFVEGTCDVGCFRISKL